MPIFRPGKPWRRRTLIADWTGGAAFDPIPWDAATGDGAWGADVAGGVTIGLAGMYLAIGNLDRSAGTVARVTSVILDRNGSRIAGNSGNSGTIEAWSSASWMGECDVGDTIKALTGGSLDGGKAVKAATSSLFVVRLGPVRWT